jgi:hypothetical protein
MSIDSAQAGGSPAASPAATPVVSPAPSSWPWWRAALFLAGAAQLITISALVGAEPVPATWSSLLLAVAPGPLAAPAAFAPTPVKLLAAVAGIAVLVVGIVAQAAHTGVFRAGAGGAGGWGRQALARAASSSGEGVSR